MVAGIGLGKSGEFIILRPIEIAPVHNHTTDGSTMPADKFGGGMYHNIRSILQGAQQIRSGKSIIDDQRDTVLVCNFRHRFDIDNIGIGISQTLNKQ
ncbi:hypothetical protein SDC9_189580 [bioreactor metagenome]|uniref:Uncharacterized protein n=1 Tax=bioreactor metagenome TaxID=1076179 RepID=A0A645I0S1_9ZZZZ